MKDVIFKVLKYMPAQNDVNVRRPIILSKIMVPKNKRNDLNNQARK